MPTDPIPKFIEDPAVKLWAKVAVEGKRLILSNAWCSRCSRGVTINDYTGSIVGGDLLLSGFCSECNGSVASRRSDLLNKLLIYNDNLVQPD